MRGGARVLALQGGDVIRLWHAEAEGSLALDPKEGAMDVHLRSVVGALPQRLLERRLAAAATMPRAGIFLIKRIVPR